MKENIDVPTYSNTVEGSVEKAHRETGASQPIFGFRLAGLWTAGDERPQDTGGG